MLLAIVAPGGAGAFANDALEPAAAQSLGMMSFIFFIAAQVFAAAFFVAPAFAAIRSGVLPSCARLGERRPRRRPSHADWLPGAPNWLPALGARRQRVALAGADATGDSGIAPAPLVQAGHGDRVGGR